MTNMLIELEPTFSGTTLTVVNAETVTGFSALRDGANLGSPIEKPMYSRTVDSLGVRVTGASADAREQQFKLRVKASTVAQLEAYLDALVIACFEITHQGGGIMRYRSAQGTYVNTYRVAFAQVGDLGEIAEYEGMLRQTVTLAMVVDPYGLPDAYDIIDSFTFDTLGTAGRYNRFGADWTKVSGAAASVSAGVLNAPNTTGNTIYTHTGTPHTYGDVQVTTKPVFTTRQTNAVAAVILKWIDASNYIYARILDDGANSILSIRKVTAGSDAALATPVTVNLATRIASAGTQWIRARIEGNTVFAEHWLTQPTPTGTPTNTVSGQLSAAEIVTFGKAVRGRVGLLYNGIGLTTITFDDFDVDGCSYRAWTFPDVLPLNASWGGTVDAQAAVYYTNTAGGTAPTWMLYAWWPKVGAHNMLWNGGGEVIGNVTTTAYGWAASAVTGVTGAATSVARGTTAANIRTGNAYVEAVCPATANTGVTNAIYRRFKAGETYTVSAWLRAASGTTTARIRLGMNGDIASTTAVALSTTWTLHTTTWVPAADRDVAYFCAEITAATGTTFQIDDAMVYAGTTAPTFVHGGAGPGILDCGSYDSAKASLSTDGTYWTAAADANYRLGTRLRGTGAMTTTANVEFHIRPDLFVPDDFTQGEIDIAVFARVETASTMTSVSCAMSVAPEGGTNYGARRYGSRKSAGTTLKIPSSGSSVFRPYYLGTVTCRVDRSNPLRWKLRLSFTNSALATGNFGLDYLILVPARNVARSRFGCAAAVVPSFIASTSQTTKLTRSDLSCDTFDPASVFSTGGYPDDSIGGQRIVLDRTAAELLVWPSDRVPSATDSDTSSMAKSFTGTVQVAAQPQHHLLRQS